MVYYKEMLKLGQQNPSLLISYILRKIDLHFASPITYCAFLMSILNTFLIPFAVLFSSINGQVLQQQIDKNEPNIYANMVIAWQRRILYCAPSKNGRHSGQCYLTVGKDGQPKPAKCHEETVQMASGETDIRTLCNIECRGADRDSVISKVPSWTRECIRYFSYDTAREPLPKQFGDAKREWLLWRGGRCRLMEISLEVHCGFP